MPIANLPDRGVVEVAGDDRISFLQGLVSNDVALAAPGRAVWAALLTPQGKWQADFFIFAAPDRLLLDCARDAAPTIAAALSRFRLRAKVTLRDASPDFTVTAGWAAAPMPEAALAAPDPRLSEAGWRTLSVPSPSPPDGGRGRGEGGARSAMERSLTPDTTYDLHRLALALPDGAPDLEPGKTTLLEAGFDELNGISWTKGCYMGQELTARTKYRGLLKKRLFPVAVEGPLPPPGTPITREGAEAGEMRSGRDGFGLASLRIESVEAGGTFRCADAVLTPRIAPWMRLPARETA